MSGGVEADKVYVVQWNDPKLKESINAGGCMCEDRWIPANTSGNKPNKSTTQNLIEKARLLAKGEPEKSLIKKGITNSDDTLTSDGQQLFFDIFVGQTRQHSLRTKQLLPSCLRKTKSKGVFQIRNPMRHLELGVPLSYGVITFRAHFLGNDSQEHRLAILHEVVFEANP